MHVLLLYKQLCITPLEAIQAWRRKHPALRDAKLGYAGRLDPMAEGLLLVLVGEENKKRKDYENLPKEYAFDVLLGLTTDTYDILGKVTHIADSVSVSSESEIKKLFSSFLGIHEQPYPPYSSKPVDGKPLYKHAREGTIAEITIPSKEITITALMINNTKTIQSVKLLQLVHERIASVHGDFRQQEILKQWDVILEEKKQAFPVLSCHIACSSGTYVRSLAHTIGNRLKTGGIALAIQRTRIGDYTLADVEKV
ncbi:MAG: hypothetical protein HY430_02115 [Candidatus Levybacteria bacterium]|nr:hypothetical protein [Candidatus Levybacteria bacterium]